MVHRVTTTDYLTYPQSYLQTAHPDLSRLEFCILHDEANISILSRGHSNVTPTDPLEVRFVWQIYGGRDGYTVYDEAGKVIIRNLQAKTPEEAHSRAYELAMSILPLLCREIGMKDCIKDQDALIEDLEADIRDLEDGDV